MANLSPEAKKRKLEYDKRYAKENFQGKYVTFNRKIKEEYVLYEWMKSQPEPANTYLKRLIREDMQRALAEETPNV